MANPVKPDKCLFCYGKNQGDASDDNYYENSTSAMINAK